MKRIFAVMICALMVLAVSSCAWADKLFDYPIEDTSIGVTCAYHGYEGHNGYHNGYDLGAGYGTAVYALFEWNSYVQDALQADE